MSSKIVARLALPALFLVAASSSAAVNSRIFSSGFEYVAPPPPAQSAEPTFVNETELRLDTVPMTPMGYVFDALWVDFNNDGCYDAFVFNHAAPGQGQSDSRLWVNRCDGTNTFTRYGNSEVNYAIPNPAGAHASGWLSLLDVDGDGLQDYWARSADQHGAWLRNATPAGAHVPWFSTKLQACTDHCVFGDVDGDHRLDIIHTDRSVETIPDRSRFIAPSGSNAEVIAADVDGDGWVDIVQPELGGYWHNAQGQLQWRDSVFQGRPVHYVVADFDNNGTMDLMLFTEHARTSGKVRLYRNDGNGQFVDVTAGSGLEAVAYNSYWTSYGNSVAADFDNDGLQDLLIAAASRSPSVTVMRNLGGLKFAIADANLGTAGHGSAAYKSRAAVADFDNDGWLDIIKVQDLTTVGIWRNTTATAGANWMKVRVRGEGLNSDGVGADIRWYRHGSSALVAHMAVQVSEQHPQTWLHTGLGANASVDLVVTYPNGGPSYRFDGLSSNQEVLVFPNGCLVQHWQPGNGWPLAAPSGCSD